VLWLLVFLLVLGAVLLLFVSITAPAMAQASVGATEGEWGIWREPIADRDAAIAELTEQVNATEPVIGHMILLDAGGKCPAIAGCGPTSDANAAAIVAAHNALRPGGWLHTAHEEALATVAAQAAEIAALKKALRPFAKSGELLVKAQDAGNFWAYRPVGGDEYAITGLHLLAAHAAIGDATLGDAA
jgi:hypothetical protein